ncbi:DUF3265 domain-containing protein [Vibrio vulnificus]|nr:DUF3265 domain-containing protein [Vibrio vulnificus]
MRETNITNASRRIRNAWHFYYALILVIYVVCGNIALRCSPLKRALGDRRNIEHERQGCAVYRGYDIFAIASNWYRVGYATFR